MATKNQFKIIISATLFIFLVSCKDTTNTRAVKVLLSGKAKQASIDISWFNGEDNIETIQVDKQVIQGNWQNEMMVKKGTDLQVKINDFAGLGSNPDSDLNLKLEIYFDDDAKVTKTIIGSGSSTGNITLRVN